MDGLFPDFSCKLGAQALRRRCPLQAHHYHNWRQREIRKGAAWVADFTFESRLDQPNWVIIDHHPTETCAQQAQLVHDVNKSAGLLCYELCQEHGLASPAPRPRWFT